MQITGCILYLWRNCNGFMFEDNPTTPSSELLCYTFPGKYYFSGDLRVEGSH